ncbi:MAG: hypothetical protein RL509_1415 [Pseudomonadota bacterium]
MSSVAASLAQLWVYPVKSCAGTSVLASALTETGLEWDRAWMVTDAQGRAITQRQLPAMALITTRIRLSDIQLKAPGMLGLHLSMNEVEAPMTVQVWGDTVPAYDMGQLASQWLGDFLGQTERGQQLLKQRGPFHLVRFDPEHPRTSDPSWTGDVKALNQFSDGFPLLVVSEASLAELNRRLNEAGHAAVGMERFRPNLVLSGLSAHEEDQLRTLRMDVGGRSVTLQLVKPCGRCSIPDVNPQTGEADDAVGQVLASYRLDAGLKGEVTFGMNAIVTEGLVAADSEEDEPVLRVSQACQLLTRA